MQFVVAGLLAVAVFFVGTFFVIRDLGPETRSGMPGSSPRLQDRGSSSRR